MSVEPPGGNGTTSVTGFCGPVLRLGAEGGQAEGEGAEQSLHVCLLNDGMVALPWIGK